MDPSRPERTEKSAHKSRRRQLTGQLAAGIAHDFNNLLATVLGSLELMDRRVGRLPEAERERFQAWIHRSIDAIQRAGNLTSKLLAFSRRQPEGSQQVDVNRLISDMLVLAAGSIGRRIQISTELELELEPVAADPVQLETVLLHLLLDAREAMPDGGKLMIATAREETSVRITVLHSGSGIDPEQEGLEMLMRGIGGTLRFDSSGTSLLLPRPES